MFRNVAVAPWRADFLADVAKMAEPVFVLSTVSDGAPRARNVILRGMFGELSSEGAVTSELLTVTTDARMAKVAQVRAGGGDSGGGAAVEAVLWAAESRTQWRLTGRAFLVGRESAAPVCVALRARMRGAVATDGGFRDEVDAQFARHSPAARGWFRHPPPGVPMADAEPGLSLGQLVHDLDDEVARRNFCLLVVAPEEVDRVHVPHGAPARRRRYRLHDGWVWDEAELWP